jgi:deazaflavin-dependent oxidoreductase (nitroreductase family)
MGIAERLDYRLPDRNAFHGMVAAAFGTRPGGWFGYHVAPRLDRASQRLTNGRGTITEWFAGVPPIWLTTTGARTGEERLTPLFGIPFREDIALIGTGFGRAPTPAWVYNLEADPAATVAFRDNSAAVHARPTSGSERDHIWKSGAGVYPGFTKYRQRVSHRDVRVFVLEPA